MAEPARNETEPRDPDEVIEPNAERGHAAVVPVRRDETQSGLALAGPEARIPALARLNDDEFDDLIHAMQKQVERISIIHRSVMKPDVHYGKIPGTDKDTLLQPGADLLIRMHNGVATYPPEHLTRTMIPQPEGVAPLVVWDAICEVRDRATGVLIGIGSGSCNSHESKYRYRRGSRRCPSCGNGDAFMKSKREPEWFCWAKRGGCGETFPENDSRVKDQVVGKVENPDVMDLDNTIKKMAMKRAKVSAANEISLASSTFTQDLEDLAENERAARGEDEEADGKPPTGSGRQAQRRQQPANSSRRAAQTVDDIVGGGATVTGGAEARGNGARRPAQARTQARPATTPQPPPADGADDPFGDLFGGE